MWLKVLLITIAVGVFTLVVMVGEKMVPDPLPAKEAQVQFITHFGDNGIVLQRIQYEDGLDCVIVATPMMRERAVLMPLGISCISK